MKKKILIIVAILLLAGAGLAFAGRQRISQWLADATRPAVPAAEPASDFLPSAAAATATATSSATAQLPAPSAQPATTAPAKPPPKDLNLAVPFALQAPHQDWSPVYEDACEEASAAMIDYYWTDKKFADADAIDAELKREFAWEDQVFGYDKDTDAEQVARMLREFYGRRTVKVLPVATAEDIRVQLRAGRPVIVPAYGKALGNPNFKNGGPVYHMLVIKGYLGTDRFITNDPGTRKGADYVYPVDTVVNAIHDWNGGDVPNGKKVMIVTYSNQ